MTTLHWDHRMKLRAFKCFNLIASDIVYFEIKIWFPIDVWFQILQDCIRFMSLLFQ